jgi:hypothetical protein
MAIVGILHRCQHDLVVLILITSEGASNVVEEAFGDRGFPRLHLMLLLDVGRAQILPTQHELASHFTILLLLHPEYSIDFFELKICLACKDFVGLAVEFVGLLEEDVSSEVVHCTLDLVVVIPVKVIPVSLNDQILLLIRGDIILGLL